MTAARRRAYRFVAELIATARTEHSLDPNARNALWPIHDAMLAASKVEDGPGVAEQDKTNTNGVR